LDNGEPSPQLMVQSAASWPGSAAVTSAVVSPPAGTCAGVSVSVTVGRTFRTTSSTVSVRVWPNASVAVIVSV
jgi:hypothetical protein